LAVYARFARHVLSGPEKGLEVMVRKLDAMNASLRLGDGFYKGMVLIRADEQRGRKRAVSVGAREIRGI
jgi:hypothetical protein